MKKRTKLQPPPQQQHPIPVEEEAEREKPRPRGPAKEKTQVTLRLDKEMMDQAYKQIKEDNSRITDIMERGLMLALAESGYDVSKIARKARFIAANATREQQKLILGLAAAMIEPLLNLNDIDYHPAEAKFYELMKWFLETRHRKPHFDVCIDYYSRYGKTAEEIAELANL